MSILLTDEEIKEAISSSVAPLTKIDRDVVAKAQLVKLYKWGDEDCPHDVTRSAGAVLYWSLKRNCDICWQALLKECDG